MRSEDSRLCVALSEEERKLIKDTDLQVTLET